MTTIHPGLTKLWTLLVRRVGVKRMAVIGRKADLMLLASLSTIEDALSRVLPVEARRVIGMYLASTTASGSSRIASVACARMTNDAVALLCLVFLGGIFTGYICCVLQRHVAGATRKFIELAWRRGKQSVFSSKVVRTRVETELENFKSKLVTDFNKTGGLSFTELPAAGLSQSVVEEQLLKWAAEEERHWVSGKLSGCVYHDRDAADSIGTKAYSAFSLTNPLHPSVFPAVRKMESEILGMTASLFHWSGGETDSPPGVVTSGGTESILLSVLAYRSWGRSHGISKPNIVAPETIHAAFDKACNYFCVELRKVPLDSSSMELTPRAMRRRIDSNTVALAVSAVSFPHGTLDPVEEIAAIAKKAGVGCHVDCCLGSFLIPFAGEAGFPLRGRFDFDVDGVTSITCDPHKYGNCPKGISVLLFREIQLRRYMFESNRVPDWSGGVYATGTMAGSRPGGLVAGAWAVMVATGREGYVNAARAILSAARELQETIQGIDGLVLVGHPALSVVAFTATAESQCNILNLSDVLSKKGWELNALQNPTALHVAVTMPMVAVINELIRDIRDGMKTLLQQVEDGTAENGPTAVMYGATASMPAEIVEEVIDTYLETCLSASHTATANGTNGTPQATS